MKNIRHLIKNCEGANALEYALIAAFIAVATILAVSNLGSNVDNTFSTVANNL